MVRFILVIMIALCGCSVKSTSMPIIGAKLPDPYGWRNPVDGWCKRNPDDIDCKKAFCRDHKGDKSCL